MSSGPNDVPSEPNRRSPSSALFSAFRTLTGRRPGNTPSPSPITSSLITPTALTQSETVTSSLEAKAEPSRNGEIGTFDNGIDSIAQQHGKVLVRNSVQANEIIGGPPELPPLLEELGSGRPLPERLAAVDKVCGILAKYPVSNVLLVWTTASDLLDLGGNPEAIRAGYTLLQSCVKVSELSPLERSIFFKAIARNRTKSDFDLRIQSLVDLTHGGRNVESFEGSVAQFLGTSLTDCFARDKDTRRENRKRKDGPLTNADNRPDDELDRMFQFVIDVVRFNSKIFREQDIALLLHQIVKICRKTARSQDVEKSVTLFDMLVTYTQIPAESLRPCLELFCDVYRQLKDVQDLTWRALSNLLKSHAGPSAVTALLQILRDIRIAQGAQKNVSRGAIRVVQRLLIADGSDGLPKLYLSDVFPALKASLIVEHRRLESDILELVSFILTDQFLTSQLLKEDDWSDLVEVLILCSRGLSSPYPSEPLSTSERTPSEPDMLGESLMRTFVHLQRLHLRADFVQREYIFKLFMRSAHLLDHTSMEFLVRQHAEERLLHPSNAQWENASRDLLERVFTDMTRQRRLRIQVLELLIDSYETIEGVYADGTVLEYAKLILDNISSERDLVVLEVLANFAVSVAENSDIGLFRYILEQFRKVLDDHSAPLTNVSSSTSWSSGTTMQAPDTTHMGSLSNTVTKALVRIFIRTLNTSGEKTQDLYDLLLYIAGSTACQTDARVSALKLLFRLRSDARHAILISPSSEGQDIAFVLCRTAETAVVREDDSSNNRAVEESPMGLYRAAGSPSPHSSLTRQTSRPNNVASRVAKPIAPLWMYPGPRGLPDEPRSSASHLVFAYIDPESKVARDARRTLKLALWLELLISIIQRDDDWEIYSYVLVHFGPQLTNRALFKGCVPQIKMVRNVLCEQLRATSFQEPPGYTSLKKADVAVCLFYTLTVLISYHQFFEKSEEDELVRTFLFGIGSWDRTSKWCIHAITICCHELPLSTSKTLDSIIQKMSQVVTQQQIAVHILEFLTALSRMPELYKNFREDDFKMVFGVSFRYLQHVRYQRENLASSNTLRNSNSGYGTLRHSGPFQEFSTVSEQEAKPKEIPAAHDLPQYVLALAYQAIAFWFLSMRLQDRRNHMAWITKNLIHIDNQGKEVMEEQAQVTIDLMQRVAFSDRDETMPDSAFAGPEDGEVSKKTWIVGHSLLTVETAARTGASQVTTRRASGTRYLTMRPNLTRPPRHQVPINTGLAAEAFYTSSYVGILPDDIMQTIVSPFSYPTPDMIRVELISLPDDDATRRAITTFDRNPTVDSLKVGVVYVGYGQTNETEILNNVIGSPDYTSFLDDLGTLVRLKGTTINTGGLDREFDTHGEFTYIWRDRCTEIVFHVATLMPTDPTDYQTITAKKSHIGNDYVTVVFNNSGLPYKFDTIASAFNYVVIVITPEARASFVDSRLESDPDASRRFYKIQVLSRPDFPETSPASVTKVVSGRHLASCVRLIALNASYFSLVWAVREGGESISPWRNRLREIKKLRERHRNRTEERNSRTLTPPPGLGTGSSSAFAGHGMGGTMRDSAMSYKRGSASVNTNTNTERLEGRSSFLSSLGGSVDMERQGSDSTR
ncbi:hypothetical protein EJ05DRAFT_513429 [Pseudovirgaria hyperparasitica]|uniref:Rap-GAP domain-containing protein n=1 Tax=Pseudovirgaria hyperparasitica TaxID=470096 RepID=A0A6A6VZE9_9PEZI|nr:uncharacterized protein EJ05DRAFT_513429 [Pseudovirgaria hyperparasitica]KAF2755114.1 hypothetical protein EJ05DRAFT_513429 [Pseudovirgaria hyperparasitica]